MLEVKFGSCEMCHAGQYSTILQLVSCCHCDNCHSLLIVTENNMDLLSYSSGGHMSNMSFQELKSRCRQGCFLLEAPGESVFAFFFPRGSERALAPGCIT